MVGGKILKWWRNIGRPDKVDKQTYKRSKFKSSKRRLRFDRNRNSVIVRNEKKHKWYSWIWMAVRKKNKQNRNNIINNNNSLSLRDETDKETMAKLETPGSSSCKYKILLYCLGLLSLLTPVRWSCAATFQYRVVPRQHWREGSHDRLSLLISPASSSHLKQTIILIAPSHHLKSSFDVVLWSSCPHHSHKGVSEDF